MITTAIGIAATCTGLLRSWPQLARIVVRRDAEGVSALTWLLTLDAFITWEAIGIVENVVATMVFNALGFASAAAILFVLVRHRSLAWWVPVAHIATAVVMNVLCFRAFGALGTSVLGVAISMSMFVPQAIATARRPGAAVSPMTWWLAATTSTLWGVYGFLIDKYVLIIPNLVMLPAAIVILWTLSSGRPRRARLTTGPTIAD